MRKISLFFVAIAMSCSTFAQTYTEPIAVEGGMVRGIINDNVTVYCGIPFAAPPVGDLRWKTPQPVLPWQGVLTCDRFAPAPTQRETARYPKGWRNTNEMNTSCSEDCLYLNIWTPSKKSEKPLPVMIWIFGGGFHIGGTDGPVYRGDAYAKRGVIMVSIAYRLGVFGYLAHPELSKESGHGSGNYALYDQMAGIKWVKENIAAFGGDPNNITVFGQSAGSRSIQGIICSTQANKLFQRAILQSGCAIRDDAKCLPLIENEALGKSFFESIGITNLKQMRQIDAVTLEKLYEKSAFIPKFRPAIDGYLITEDFNDATIAGRYMDIDYMIGYTKDDVPKANFPKSIGAWADNQVDNLRRRPIYVYSYDHPQPKDPKTSPKEGGDEFGASGVVHSAELPYMFGQVHNSTKPMTKEDFELSERMVTYWTNFAKYGNPNDKNTVEWKAYTKEIRNVHHLNIK